MARWEPDARGRLLQAAVALFSERGYDATTAAEIAERAGLTKTTLFRHFADKREILFQGQDALVALAVGGVEGAPAGSTPFEVLRAGVGALCTMHPAELRADQRGIDALLSSSPELTERAVYKRSTVTEALRRSLSARLEDDRLAAILADLGVRAYYDGFAAWVASPVDGPLVDVVDRELEAYASVLTSLPVTSGQT
jgi:AcrR family transcriptional regulator